MILEFGICQSYRWHERRKRCERVNPLFCSQNAIISDCNDPYNPDLLTVNRGPSLSVGIAENKTQRWIGSIEIVDDQLMIENHGSYDVPLNIEFDGNGPQWTVSNGIILPAGQVTNVSAIPPESGISFLG